MTGLFPGANSVILFAFWLGVAVVLVSVLLLVVIVVMRQVVLRRERRHRAAVALWSRVLEGTLPSPSRLDSADVSGFVVAWVGQAKADPAALPKLREVARAIGLKAHLVRTLTSGGFHEHISAITTLGLLDERDEFERIAPFLDDPSPIVSLCAARALMQLDPANAISMFLPQISRREDWVSGQVASILHDADRGMVVDELSDFTLQANADVAPRLIRFLATVSPEDASPIIRRILARHPDDHLVSTCLQVMVNREDLDLVRPLLGHQRWHVRLHAATAIGRLGRPDDAPLLARLLQDEQWWVRYRAAQALSHLPSVGDSGLRMLCANQTDRYARDILEHVMAENRLGVAA